MGKPLNYLKIYTIMVNDRIIPVKRSKQKKNKKKERKNWHLINNFTNKNNKTPPANEPQSHQFIPLIQRLSTLYFV